VCPSVFHWLLQAAAAGLLLWARLAGDIDRSVRPSGAPQQHGAQQHGAFSSNASSVTLSADVGS